MTRAFIVHLEVDPSQLDYLQGLAEDIKDSLETDGHIVIEVKPFANPVVPEEPLSTDLGVAKPLGLF